MSEELLLKINFNSEVIAWRGPSPFYFATIPDEHSGAIRDAAREASYGWGVVPVTTTISAIDFTTSLFPRDGAYLLPLKEKVRRAIGAVPGDAVRVTMTIRERPFTVPLPLR